jgi:hypothetical protein
MLGEYLLNEEPLKIRIYKYNILKYHSESNAFSDNIYLTLFNLSI